MKIEIENDDLETIFHFVIFFAIITGTIICEDITGLLVYVLMWTCIFIKSNSGDCSP